MTHQPTKPDATAGLTVVVVMLPQKVARNHFLNATPGYNGRGLSGRYATDALIGFAWRFTLLVLLASLQNFLRLPVAIQRQQGRVLPAGVAPPRWADPAGAGFIWRLLFLLN